MASFLSWAGAALYWATLYARRRKWITRREGHALVCVAAAMMLIANILEIVDPRTGPVERGFDVLFAVIFALISAGSYWLWKNSDDDDDDVRRRRREWARSHLPAFPAKTLSRPI